MCSLRESIRIRPRRNLPIDLGIISDEKAALEALFEAVPKMSGEMWVAEIAAARKKFEDENAEYYKLGSSCSDAVHPAVIAQYLFQENVRYRKIGEALGARGEYVTRS